MLSGKGGGHFSHFCFYGFMLAMPLMGWIMVSTSPEFKSLPTTWFDLFTVPHLPISEPVAAAFGAATEARLPELAHNGHQLLAWLAIALLVVHVGAALKHHYADKDEVFARMAPWASPKEPVFAPPAPRASGVATALAILLLLGAGGAAAALFLTPERAAAPVIEASLAAPAADAARDEPVAAAETALASEAAAPLWTVAPEASEISFSGTQLGAPFSGAFARWRAEIRFDPEALEESAVRVEIETASAATGDIQVDGALPGADFFDSAAHPLAVFEASVFANADAAPEAAAGETAYRAEGTVTIKGVSAPVAFPFTLAIEDDQAVMRGALSLDRIAYELGLQADAAAAIISREIEVSLEVTATRGAP
ncbi:MAG: YceI family protein [Pseudomonadota bacterium]